MSWESYAPYHYWSSHCFVWKRASLEQFTDTITQMMPGESGTYHSGEVLCISLQTAGCTAALVWIANMLLSLATDAAAIFHLSSLFPFSLLPKPPVSLLPLFVLFQPFSVLSLCVFPFSLLLPSLSVCSFTSRSLSLSLCAPLSPAAVMSLLYAGQRLLQLHFSFSEVIELWFESVKARKSIHPSWASA